MILVEEILRSRLTNENCIFKKEKKRILLKIAASSMSMKTTMKELFLVKKQSTTMNFFAVS